MILFLKGIALIFVLNRHQCRSCLKLRTSHSMELTREPCVEVLVKSAFGDFSIVVSHMLMRRYFSFVKLGCY